MKTLVSLLICVVWLFNTALSQDVSTSTVVYDSTGAIFPNPERGFSAWRESPVSLYFCNNLNVSKLKVLLGYWQDVSTSDHPIFSHAQTVINLLWFIENSCDILYYDPY